MRNRGTFTAPSLLVGVVAFLAPSALALADPVVFTDRDAWLEAVDGLEVRVEDFNGLPAEPLGPGPTVLPGGGLSVSLSGIGSNGSFTGVIASGEHDGSRALQVRLVHDSSDFELFAGFVVRGEGVERVDVEFASPVIAFGAEFRSVTTHDGATIAVNGVEIDLHDYYPDDELQDGDGFLGVVDVEGISAFQFVPDDLEPEQYFEQFEIDDLYIALGGGQTPGDCNADGTRNIADVVCYVKTLFPGFLLLNRNGVSAACPGTLDVNGDGVGDTNDVVALANFLVSGTGAIGPACSVLVAECDVEPACE